MLDTGLWILAFKGILSILIKIKWMEQSDTIILGNFKF
jgi:hypothetical protein